ncbi:hypothetical protein GCM10010172_06830 [Paractinoplanes ferrugineus]|uniref:Uncharacterized protein n=1 Tax=Paractinoplanes ferrugineus TaxID=113564 RepID=A0A919JA28_9ACTN|nr:hypothetical protein [Actinoplanes ferrugineus]GIE16289.1 hypothetical protein Afe05nite_81290 [Actinoplanes ferrugineus]
MTDLLVSGAIQARHNWNRWVVDCGNCPSALTVPPGTPHTQCWDCGFLIGPIVWPRDPDGIVAILSYRPDPNTRNWDPGETMEDLLAQNAEAGDIPAEWLELKNTHGQLVVMDVVDGFMTGGVLMERRALLAGDRPQHVIGA